MGGKDRAKARKFLEEKIEQKLHGIGFDSNFLDMIPKAQTTKAKLDRFYLIKIKNLSVPKDTINSIKNNLLSGQKYLKIKYWIYEFNILKI